MSQWQRGQSGNPAGRPKGARNKLGEEFIEALAQDFATGGIEAIQRVRADDPSTYLRVVASLVAKQVEIGPATRDVHDMTEDQLLAVIQRDIPAAVGNA